MTDMIDVSPDVHLVNSMRSRNLGWEKALAELIDNAFDAKANQVKITAQSRTVSVSDDGAGVRDLASTVTSGRHVASETTELGMFGVGLKDAWHWAGHRMDVETVHGGKRGHLVADSREMIKLGDWKVPAPTFRDSSDATGTKITLHLSNSAPRRNCPSELVYQSLAWIFTPALMDGRQIMVPSGKKIKPLKAVPLPDFIEVVEETFTVEGKEVHIKIGIVADGQKMQRGPFWIQYGHRNIMRKPIGCGSYSADRIGGIIRLKKGDWVLSANKDDLTDYKDELAAEIFSRIEWMLKKAEHLSEEIASDELRSELESELNEAIVTAKKTEREKRPGIAGTIGSINASTTGRRRRKAAVSDPLQDGSVEGLGPTDLDGNRRRKRGIHLAFGELENGTLGEYDDLSNRVTLNKLHPFVERARKDKEMKVALHAIAFSLICHWAVGNVGNQKLLFESEDFGICYGRVLASLKSEECDDAKEAV